MKTINRTIEKEKPSLYCLSLGVDTKDDEIREIIQQLLPICKATEQGFCLSISGYDNDPRELWQIPEAIQFMQKMIHLGFISILEVSTTSSELMSKAFKAAKLPGFGALEVWMCARGKMSKGNNDIDSKTLSEFYLDLRAANVICDLTCKVPNGIHKYNPGIKTDKKTIPDGQIKHQSWKN